MQNDKWQKRSGCIYHLSIAAAASRPEIPAAPPAPSAASPRDLLKEAFGADFGETRVQRAFLNDFKGRTNAFRAFDYIDPKGRGQVRAVSQRVLDLDSNADFGAIYVPSTPLTFDMLARLAEEFEEALQDMRDFSVTMQEEGNVNRLGGRDMKFTGALYLYTEDALSIEEMAELRRLFRAKGALVLFKHPGTMQPVPAGR